MADPEAKQMATTVKAPSGQEWEMGVQETRSRKLHRCKTGGYGSARGQYVRWAGEEQSYPVVFTGNRIFGPGSCIPQRSFAKILER